MASNPNDMVSNVAAVLGMAQQYSLTIGGLPALLAVNRRIMSTLLARYPQLRLTHRERRSFTRSLRPRCVVAVAGITMPRQADTGALLTHFRRGTGVAPW